MNQFLNKERNIGDYLYVPKSDSSKSIDFAISNINNFFDVVVYKIYFFQVTVDTNISKISEKINTFLEGYIYVIGYLL